MSTIDAVGSFKSKSTQRRSFLSGILAAAAAPAIVKAESLMPTWTPKWHRGGIAAPASWTLVRGTSNESVDPRAFDAFVVAQLRLISEAIGVPTEQLIVCTPNMQLEYSSARVALLEQFSKTPSIWPRDVRSNHGQFPS